MRNGHIIGQGRRKTQTSEVRFWTTTMIFINKKDNLKRGVVHRELKVQESENVAKTGTLSV